MSHPGLDQRAGHGCGRDLLCERPASLIVRDAPHAGLGFIEAHGLALIFAILLWRAPATGSWHGTGAAIHLLLGTANLVLCVFWESFVAAQSLTLG